MARLLTRGLGSSPGLDQNRALGHVRGLKRPAFINGRGGPRARGGTDLGHPRGRLRETSLVVVLLVPLAWSGPVARAAGDDPDWKKDKAVAYLDGRQTWWMESGVAKRAMGTTCVACHTGLPYALARPALGGDTKRYEAMLQSVRKRVENWDEVGPLYPSKADGRGGPRRSSTRWCSPRPTPAGAAGRRVPRRDREGLRTSLGAATHRGQGEGVMALAGVRRIRLRAVGSLGRRILRGRPRRAGRGDGTRRRGRGPAGPAEKRCATIWRRTTTARISMPGSPSSGPRRRSTG